MQTLLLDRRTQDMIEGYVPEGEVLTSLVRFFSIFADNTRLRMLSALAISEMCVTDISRVLGINQTTVSHQLRFLKDAGMVRTDRGQTGYFPACPRLFLCECLKNTRKACIMGLWAKASSAKN